MKHDIPFGYWKTRGYLRTVPLSYLIRIRRQLARHNAFRWAVAVEINRRIAAAESK
jgi:hypothetical protein